MRNFGPPIRIWFFFFFFSSRRRHTRYWRDWSSDVCSSDLASKTYSPKASIQSGFGHAITALHFLSNSILVLLSTSPRYSAKLFVFWHFSLIICTYERSGTWISSPAILIAFLVLTAISIESSIPFSRIILFMERR